MFVLVPGQPFLPFKRLLYEMKPPGARRQSRTEGTPRAAFQGRGQLRSISKTMLRTCAGLAVTAGLVVGGAGMASAATASPTVHSNHHPGPRCNPFARERWNLNGKNNQVKAVYLGNTYTYSATFKQYGSCLSGSLTDSYYPTTGPISGTVNKNNVTFTFVYPSGSVQGTRTYTGTINRWGFVSGTWSQTGSQGGGGTFTLAKNAQRACPWWYQRWNHNAACPVFPHH